MPHRRRSGPTADQLHQIGLRATEQRVALLSLLFGGADRHVTADSLYREARAAGIAVVRATVYNTLHALAQHGLLRAIVVDAERTYFDTNTTHSCHLYCEDSGTLHNLDDDLPALRELLEQLGAPPADRVDVLIRLKAGARPPGHAAALPLNSSDTPDGHPADHPPAAVTLRPPPKQQPADRR
ncbi:Fur family transcriptional regulator [Arenibaculum pallidiluteum]|uniref:Fur family transcriptional regulator n=1 Tax=Arenibaculum pallidiluteum TaxID=2812559 RepID=UPI001A96B4C5|nr:transcriptional repressor [Arenibaculum pallidiluteum]